MPRFPHTAARAQGLSDEVFSDLARRAAGKRVAPLHVGDTYLEPPQGSRAEDQRSGDTPHLHGYAPVQGEPALLHAIADKLARRYGHRPEPANLQVMAGATCGLGVACTALLSPGDEVLLPAPYWPLIRGILHYSGAVPVEVPFHAEPDGVSGDPVARLSAAITERTTAIYLNSPHNPTGEVLSADTLEAIGALAEAHDLWILSDEVYEDIYFGEAPQTPLFKHPRYGQRVISNHSLSKAYGLAGARVGYCHGPAAAMEAIRGVQTFFTYCAARPMQLGAAHALAQGDAWLERARTRYRAAAQEAAAALKVPTPAGGTFLFFDAAPYLQQGEDTRGLLERLLDAGVLLTPGRATGKDYEPWLRLCFTSLPPRELSAALGKLRQALGL